jgi:endo-1,4-beta-xylanase
VTAMITRRDYLSVALESSAVKAVLTWGLTDAPTWLNEIESHREKQPHRFQRPLPFDADYKSVPAFLAMRDAFDNAPHRSRRRGPQGLALRSRTLNL